MQLLLLLLLWQCCNLVMHFRMTHTHLSTRTPVHTRVDWGVIITNTQHRPYFGQFAAPSCVQNKFISYAIIGNKFLPTSCQERKGRQRRQTSASELWTCLNGTAYAMHAIY